MKTALKRVGFGLLVVEWLAACFAIQRLEARLLELERQGAPTVTGEAIVRSLKEYSMRTGRRVGVL